MNKSYTPINRLYTILLFFSLITTSLFAKLEFSPETYSFGESFPHQTIQGSVTITNTSSYNFIIDDVRSDCGCLLGEFNVTNISPNSKEELDFKLETRAHLGELNRNIYIIGHYSNEPDQRTAYTYKLTTNVLPHTEWEFPAFGEITLLNSKNFLLSFKYNGDIENMPSISDVRPMLAQNVRPYLTLTDVKIEDNNINFFFDGSKVPLADPINGLFSIDIKGQDYKPAIQFVIINLVPIDMSRMFDNTSLGPFPLIMSPTSDNLEFFLENPDVKSFDIQLDGPSNYSLTKSYEDSKVNITLHRKENVTETEVVFINFILEEDYIKVPVIVVDSI